jgi:hypothetical protein
LVTVRGVCVVRFVVTEVIPNWLYRSSPFINLYLNYDWTGRTDSTDRYG